MVRPRCRTPSRNRVAFHRVSLGVCGEYLSLVLPPWSSLGCPLSPSAPTPCYSVKARGLFLSGGAGGVSLGNSRAGHLRFSRSDSTPGTPRREARPRVPQHQSPAKVHASIFLSLSLSPCFSFSLAPPPPHSSDILSPSYSRRAAATAAAAVFALGISSEKKRDDSEDSRDRS